MPNMLFNYLSAKYVDLKLKLGNKRMDDLEIEKTLDEVLVLFRYIQGIHPLLYLLNSS
jgi:hypothetical protein